MGQKVREGKQLYIFDELAGVARLDSSLWSGSFNGRESTLQQLAPYVGKMKSGMARVLVELYSGRGETVLDPFCGSGVVPLEAALLGRVSWANDLSPYAYVLTRGKLEAPNSREVALREARELVGEAEALAPTVALSNLPIWVSEFFHPDTLREVVAAFAVLRKRENFFLMSCLLGILHHVRPGFLSYPSSHLVPYVRRSKYPPATYPEMYAYRDLRSRLFAKVKRAYRRALVGGEWERRRYQVWQANAMALPLEQGTVDTIISSPPYFGALDYARDNRLRLWFLGCDDWKKLDSSLTANPKVYLAEMSTCLREMFRALKCGGRCVLVLGDVERDGTTRRTAEILADAAVTVTDGGFVVNEIYTDALPDERRSRRRTRTTKLERILIMVKR